MVSSACTPWNQVFQVASASWARTAAATFAQRSSAAGVPITDSPIVHNPDCPQLCPHVWRSRSTAVGAAPGPVRSAALVVLGDSDRNHQVTWPRGSTGGRRPAGPSGERDAIAPSRSVPTSHKRTTCPPTPVQCQTGWIAGVRDQPVHSSIHLCACARTPAARPPRGPTSARAFEEAMREADIPAEQPEAEEEARIPAPDAEPGGTRGDSSPAQQGPLPISQPDLASPWPDIVSGPGPRASAPGGKSRSEKRHARTRDSAAPRRLLRRAVGRTARSPATGCAGGSVPRVRELRADPAGRTGYLVRARPVARRTTRTGELSATLRAILGRS